MERKLYKSGNGHSLFIPSTILKLLNINPDTDLVVYTVENDILKITKSKNKQKDK